MYVDEIDFDALTVEKLIDLVFTEMVYRKIQQLEEETLAKRDQTDGRLSGRHMRKSRMKVGLQF